MSNNKVSNLTKEELKMLSNKELTRLLKTVKLEIEHATKTAIASGKLDKENDLLKESKKYKKLILSERGRRIREEVSSSTTPTTNKITSSGKSKTPITPLQKILLRPRVKIPHVRQITKELYTIWRERGWWPLVNRPRTQALQSGIINITIPDNQEYPEYSGVTDMHVHIFPNRNQGSGIRIGFGQDDNRWRLEYNIRNAIGTFNIRNPDGNFVPPSGFSENLPLDKLIKKIKNQLIKENNKNGDVPKNLLNISYNNLDNLIYTMIYTIESVQSKRIYGGKRKTRKTRRKRKTRKTRRKRKTRKTRRKITKRKRKKNRSNRKKRTRKS